MFRTSGVQILENNLNNYHDKRRRRWNICSIGSLTEWEVVFLGGTALAKVNLVKGHELPTIVKVLPVGFHLSPTSVNT
ncbi:hypothetical protein Tco_1561300 [Tanacetum coccineum]